MPSRSSRAPGRLLRRRLGGQCQATRKATGHQQGDFEEGMRAAEAIGDDTLQRETQEAHPARAAPSPSPRPTSPSRPDRSSSSPPPPPPAAISNGLSTARPVANPKPARSTAPATTPLHPSSRRESNLGHRRPRVRPAQNYATAVVALLPAAQVSCPDVTGSPLVAAYSINLALFGQSLRRIRKDHRLRPNTWQVPSGPSGGPVKVLVAGMIGKTLYHHARSRHPR